MNRRLLFFAWRFMRHHYAESTISMMVKFVFLGIFIASFALATILGIMRGIEHATHEKLQGIHAQIIVRAYGDFLNEKSLRHLFEQEFNEIQASSPVCMQQLIIQQADNEHHVVMIKGIDPALEGTTNTLATKLSCAPFSFAPLTQPHAVFIGQTLATTLRVTLDDTIPLLIAHTDSNNEITFKKSHARIAGIFKTGIDEYDGTMLIASIDFFKTLFPNEGISIMQLQLKTSADEALTIKKLRERLGIEVYSWKDLYPALVSALKLEKYATFIVLALIVLVASLSIVSLLSLQITQKQTDIALLTAMGMPKKQLQYIFISIGMGISALACGAGLLATYAVGYLLNNYPCIELPDTYYVTSLPFTLDWYLYGLVFITTMVLCLFATWIPTRTIALIKSAHILRFES